MAQFEIKDGVAIIPARTKKIKDSAFEGCTSLENITIPEGVKEIGWWAFSGCTSLESIVVADGNSVYDSREGCNAIIETTTNTLIQGCKTTVIPESVTEIGSLAFRGCSSLKCVTFLSRTKLSDEVFSYSSRRTINVPRDCVDYYKEVLPA